MEVLVIGSGGREHALAWKVAQSSQVSKVFVAPGNAGTANEPEMENIDIAATDLKALIAFVQKQRIELTIVGPEVPLVEGIVDEFQKIGLPIFGPTKKAAQLEGSKTFTKEFLERHQIPTAEYASFTDINKALKYLANQRYPIVIKADGLAAGKGVIIAEDETTANHAISDMLADNKFGEAGHRVIIEEFLRGEEASFIVMSDGKHILPLATSQDHKARDNNDTGPNTGGMGAYSPAPVVTEEVYQRIMQQVIEPTIKGMAAENNVYTGFLYAGVMIDTEGNPKVLEYNCRFGDPETQPIMMRLQSDLVELCLATIHKKLNEVEAKWNPKVCLGVVLAAGGYPASYPKGDVITGLQDNIDETKVFHAGTKLKDNQVITHGGRVLCVCALGEDTQTAQQKAYERASKIQWKDLYYRTDIGFKAIK